VLALEYVASHKSEDVVQETVQAEEAGSMK